MNIQSLGVVAALLLLATVVAPAQAQPAPAVGDPVQGQRQFGQCRACHTVTRQGANGVGPNLFGIYGARAGAQQPRFAFTPALRASGVVWDDATLDRWLTDPGLVVKGTRMEFIGIPRQQTRLNIIAYLKTLK